MRNLISRPILTSTRVEERQLLQRTVDRLNSSTRLKVNDEHRLRNLSFLSRAQEFLTSLVVKNSRNCRKGLSRAWYVCCSMIGVRYPKGALCSNLQSHHELIRTQTIRGVTNSSRWIWGAANQALNAYQL